ncbi:phage portal protein [Clostridium pasteurianum]|uniref:Phage portal protein, SPP1 Gp6 n=1 Tax=Clostridium pasteurianum BC1 TaxID=86416 RepID=R4K4T6_CLOPA|nr:phage portal protein [Clostridium pasteurianum]AGK98177.1 Phage portal protein, SPP1 Gp6 [Clostridium pasteurianum BC1]
MLTDLSFLDIDQPWPPQNETDRLQQYQTNKRLFEGDHTAVYADQFHRIERVIGNFQDIISYAVLANFQKIISLKTADLLLGEAPQIKIDERSSVEQKTVDSIVESSDLINTAYENTIDISRYGDGLFFIYKDTDTGAGRIDVTQPSIWFPIVSADNVKKIQYHVLAWTFEVKAPQKTGFWQQFFTSTSEKESFLKVQIHSKGSYEEKLYKLENGTPTRIKELISSDVKQTGLNNFAIVQVSNIITSDRITGLNDYDDISSLISELEVRVSQVARILDKHAAPSVQGPSTAIEKDPRTGQYALKMGNYFPRDSTDDPPVEYVTWDAQLNANFTIINKLINLLYTISEMGNTIFGDMSGQSMGTGNLSGIALRRLMMSPLAKVNRIRMRMDTALKKALKLCSQLGGEGIVDLSDKPISIIWKDGLPEDPQEMAQVMQIRTGSKPTISQFRAVQQLDNTNDIDTQLEIDRINEDEARTNPMSGQNFPFSSTAVNTDPNNNNKNHMNMGGAD